MDQDQLGNRSLWAITLTGYWLSVFGPFSHFLLLCYRQDSSKSSGCSLSRYVSAPNELCAMQARRCITPGYACCWPEAHLRSVPHPS